MSSTVQEKRRTRRQFSFLDRVRVMRRVGPTPGSGERLFLPALPIAHGHVVLGTPAQRCAPDTWFARRNIDCWARPSCVSRKVPMVHEVLEQWKQHGYLPARQKRPTSPSRAASPEPRAPRVSALPCSRPRSVAAAAAGGSRTGCLARLRGREVPARAPRAVIDALLSVCAAQHALAPVRFALGRIATLRGALLALDAFALRGARLRHRSSYGSP